MQVSGITAPGSGTRRRKIGVGSVFHGIRDQANNKNGFRDQNAHRFRIRVQHFG